MSYEPVYPLSTLNKGIISWSKSQVAARSHPNVLTSQQWLNALYRTNDESHLKLPLVYADRLRIRQPGPAIWSAHPPHIDGSLFHCSSTAKGKLSYCRWRHRTMGGPRFQKCLFRNSSG